MNKNTITFEDLKEKITANMIQPIKDGLYSFDEYLTDREPIKFGKALAFPITLIAEDGRKHSTLDIVFLNGLVGTKSLGRTITDMIESKKEEDSTLQFQFPTSKVRISMQNVVDSEGKLKLNKQNLPIQNIIFNEITIEDCLVSSK